MSGLPETLLAPLTIEADDEEGFPARVCHFCWCPRPELLKRHEKGCPVALVLGPLGRAWPAIRAEVLAEAAAREERLRAALKGIVACRSRYSSDPLVRCNNAVEHCQQTAREALADTQPEETP